MKFFLAQLEVLNILIVLSVKFLTLLFLNQILNLEFVIWWFFFCMKILTIFFERDIFIWREEFFNQLVNSGSFVVDPEESTDINEYVVHEEEENSVWQKYLRQVISEDLDTNVTNEQHGRDELE